MLKQFPCAECGVAVPLPFAESVKTATCRRCGEVYLLPSQSRLYPSLHMMPVDYRAPDGVGDLSRWMPTHTRPVRPGPYHVRFRHLEPSVRVAHWDGRNFVNTMGQRIAMTQFLSWRGMLA